MNWETFNSPRFWGNFRPNNHEGWYWGLEINMTCHEPIAFPTTTLNGNECLNWKKYIYTNEIDGFGFRVQHLRDEFNLKARVSHRFKSGMSSTTAFATGGSWFQNQPQDSLWLNQSPPFDESLR